MSGNETTPLPQMPRDGATTFSDLIGRNVIAFDAFAG